MAFNGADSDQFSEISPTRGQNSYRAKELNRHFGAETALLQLFYSVASCTQQDFSPWNLTFKKLN